MNVFQKIAEVIVDHTGGDISEINEATTFEELGVDSLDIVEMVMKLEEELGVTLELEEKFESVGALTKFIESKLAD
jgi:acyl carrier protein